MQTQKIIRKTIKTTTSEFETLASESKEPHSAFRTFGDVLVGDIQTKSRMRANGILHVPDHNDRHLWHDEDDELQHTHGANVVFQLARDQSKLYQEMIKIDQIAYFLENTFDPKYIDVVKFIDSDEKLTFNIYSLVNQQTTTHKNEAQKN